MDSFIIALAIMGAIIFIIIPVSNLLSICINRNKTTVYTVEYKKLKSLIESAEKLHVEKIEVSMLLDLIEVKEEGK